MANEVKILIKAVDQASATLKKVGGGFKDMKSVVVGASAATAALTVAYMAVNKVLDETVGVMVDYAEQVRDLGRITGMSADETSRLIQVADDLKVEYGTLKQAARLMAQDGLVPNIATLAELSDQYLAIQDPMARSEWAVKNLGRSYQEMTKILEAGGDALREMAATTPGGLILSQEDLDNAREYEKAVDELNDTFVALKVTVGSAVVPTMTNIIKTTTDLITVTEDAGVVITDTGESYKLAADYAEAYARAEMMLTDEDYKNYLQRAKINAAYKDYNGLLLQEKKLYDQVSQGVLTNNVLQEQQRLKIERTNEAYKLHADALEAAQEGMDLYNAQMGVYYEAQEGVYQPALERTIEKTNDFSLAAIIAARDVDDLTRSAMEASETLGNDLANAYGKLEAAQRNWSEKVGEDAYKALEDAGAGAEKLAEGAAIVDEVFGLNITEREAYLTAQQEVAQAYADGTLNSDQYRQKLVDLAAVFQGALAKDIQIARDQVTELQTQLDILGKTKITTTVDVIVNYPNGQPPTGTWPEGTEETTTDKVKKGGEDPYPEYGGQGFVGGSNSTTGNLVINTYTNAAAAVAVAQAVARMKAGDRTTERMGG